MKHGRTDRDWAVVSVMTFGAGVVITWALTSPQPSWPTLTIEQWAAWVQAIGSLVAILIAIAVPAVQHRLAAKRKNEETLDRARSLALFIRPAIETFGENLDEIWANENPDDAGAVEDADTNQSYLGPRAQFALRIPDDLLANVSTLHELGPAASGVLRAIHCVQSADRLTTWPPTGGRKVVFDKKQFYDHLWDATGGVASCLNAIDAFFPRRGRN